MKTEAARREAVRASKETVLKDLRPTNLTKKKKQFEPATEFRHDCLNSQTFPCGLNDRILQAKPEKFRAGA